MVCTLLIQEICIFIYFLSSLVILQVGESAPGVTGWLEVEVAGKLIHSKKVKLVNCLNEALVVFEYFKITWSLRNDPFKQAFP